MEGIGSFYVTQQIRDFNEKYPDIRVDLITDARMLDLSRRQADVFLTFFKPVGRRLSVKKVGEFKVSLFAANNYFRDRSRPRRTRDLDDHHFIDFIDELVFINENRWLADIYRPRSYVFRSMSLVAQYKAICNGHGIGMLPSFVAADDAVRTKGRAAVLALLTTAIGFSSGV